MYSISNVVCGTLRIYFIFFSQLFFIGIRSHSHLTLSFHQTLSEPNNWCELTYTAGFHNSKEIPTKQNPIWHQDLNHVFEVTWVYDEVKLSHLRKENLDIYCYRTKSRSSSHALLSEVSKFASFKSHWKFFPLSKKTIVWNPLVNEFR